MEFKVLEISYELDNEEGLNALFFQTSEGYYTISRLKEEDNLYMELNSQENGKYFDTDYFDCSVRNGCISFNVPENRNWDLGIYQNITLLFSPVNIDEFKRISMVVRNIFTERTGMYYTNE